MDPIMKPESTKDVMAKRSKLMIEVTRMRKEYPSKLSRIDQTIHYMKLKKLSNVSFSRESVRNDLINYAKRRPEENIVIPNFENRKHPMKRLQESIVENECIHTELLQSKDSHSTTLCKIDQMLEDLHHLHAAHKQLLNESTILKNVRKENVLNCVKIMKGKEEISEMLSRNEASSEATEVVETLKPTVQ